MEIRLYTQDLEPSVRDFNERLRAGGERSWRLPESHIPRLSNRQDRGPYQEFFLVLDREYVRGGYLLTHSGFMIRGEQVSIACGPQGCLSEGLVDRTYGIVGVIQVEDALRRQPLMYALGMGGMDLRFPKLLTAMGWTLFPVPLYFRVVSASRFLSNLTQLRSRLAARIGLDLLRYSRLGSVGFRLAQARLLKPDPTTRTEIVAEFGPWSDTLWDKCKNKYSLIGLRDSASLNVLYPGGEARFLRLKISRSGTVIGWAVALDTEMPGDKQFGWMRVGSIVDCLAEPDDAYSIIAGCTTFLERRGVDVIVSNQASLVWGRALAAAGFLRGPSDFILGFSPKLTARLEPPNAFRNSLHMNRGDGGGPMDCNECGALDPAAQTSRD